MSSRQLCISLPTKLQVEMQKKEMKPYLIERLKSENAFWSYDADAIKDVPDDILVELVMLHLDMDDIDLLFRLYPYRQVKRAWLENIVAQGDRYYVLNKFFAWYYFKVKKPEVYVKSIATRILNRKVAV